jgi:hypothetical protein
MTGFKAKNWLTTPAQGTAQAQFLLRECLIMVICACENRIKLKALCWQSGVFVRCCFLATA